LEGFNRDHVNRARSKERESLFKGLSIMKPVAGGSDDEVLIRPVFGGVGGLLLLQLAHLLLQLCDDGAGEAEDDGEDSEVAGPDPTVVLGEVVEHVMAPW
jgi:hypothetical protein